MLLKYLNKISNEFFIQSYNLVFVEFLRIVTTEDKKFEISLGDNEVNIEIFNFYVRTCLESFFQVNNLEKP